MRYLLIAVVVLLVSCSNPTGIEYAKIIAYSDNHSYSHITIGEWCAGENPKDLITFIVSDTIMISVPVGSHLYAHLGDACDSCTVFYVSELIVSRNKIYFWNIN